ncbi:MAG: nickel pincer cofactor biosynthesis protein LarC [Planctomycetes bacterium]|nr:nickel pincer cofactor biosynthesis protein LarC [Planctomycetota bacterium]
MRTAYFDCFAGAAGDMIVGSLLDAGAAFPAVRDGIASLSLPGVRVRAERATVAGFRATRFEVERPSREGHRGLREIEEIVARAPFAARVRERSLAVFRRLANAEAAVHGTTADHVHFHEVGASDAIADVVGACLALEDLGVERIVASPPRLGTGSVESEHGRIPVPAPGTLELLRGSRARLGGPRGERTTPTGAAILAGLAAAIEGEISLRIESVGYGAGTHDFGDGPNLLRVVLGEGEGDAGEEIVEVLETNLDDVPGQVVGHALERLLQAGALDAFAAPVLMKKSRPGVVLTAIVPTSKRRDVEAVFFDETGTLGVRRREARRTILPRRAVELETAYGRVRFKEVQDLRGERRLRVEFEEARRVAGEKGIPLTEATARLEEEARRLYRPEASSASENRRKPSRTRSGSAPKPTRT